MAYILAIATRQLVANLPTLLAIARPEDNIILLESPEMQGKNKPMIKVLQQRGLQVAQPVAIPDDIAALTQQLRAYRVNWQDQPLALLLDGGTKLMALAIAQALAPLCPTLYYGQERPCNYLKLSADFSQIEAQAYACPVTLDEVLACSGYQRFENGQQTGLRLYPTRQVPMPARVYGEDEAYTVAQHENYLASVADRATASDLPPTSEDTFPAFQVLLQTQPQAVLAWQNGLLALLAQKSLIARNTAAIKATLALARANIPHPLIISPEMAQACLAVFNYLARQKLDARVRQTLLPNLGPLESFYNHVRKLLVTSKPVVSAPPAMPVAPKLGSQLEQGVAVRVLRHLAANLAQAALVAEVWLNPKIAMTTVPHIVNQEFDVLILLKNGVMLHLECKTGKIETKDLDARLLNIQQAGSSLARMCVVTPLYSAYAAKPWFRDLHHIAQRVKEFRAIKAITLTLPNQPTQYTYPNLKGEPEIFNVKPFEQSLNELFQPYLA